MSLSVELYARICAALAQTNTIDFTFWDENPSGAEDVVMTERGIASVPIIHLYQLYLEIADEIGEFDAYDEVIQTPYQSAMCVVCELIALQIADILVDPSNSAWVIMFDGRIFEYQDSDEEPKPKTLKKWPDYLRVVPSP